MSFSTDGPFPRKGRQYRYQPAETEGDVPSGASRIIPEDPTGAQAAEVQGFGMKIFLASLTMVFASTFVAYIVIWWTNRGGWQSPVTKSEVGGLVAATVLLVVADVCAAWALKRSSNRASARKLTVATLIAALVYLVVQSRSWVPLLAQARSGPNGGELRMEGFLFLMLTFAHAVHVFGGVIANAVALSRDGGPRHTSLRLLYTYWRFLTIMWAAVLALLLSI